MYNGGGYIIKLINNIILLNKNILPKIQIIIVDDGSTDNSYKLCSNFINDKAYIEIYTQQNQGIAGARNTGLKKSIGKYITFCDQDDSLLLGYENFIQRMEKETIDILISDPSISLNHVVKPMNRITIDEVVEKEKLKDLQIYYIIDSTDTKHLLQNKFPPHTIWNTIYKRDIIVKYNIKFLAIVDYEDDWRFTTEYTCYAKKCLLAKKSFYAWTINPFSESHTRKYITNFLHRKQKDIAWGIQLLNRCNFSKDLIEDFIKKESTRSIIWGFYNACALQYTPFKKEMKEILSEYIKMANFKKYSLTIIEYFYGILLCMRLIHLCYLINAKILKRIYH